LVLSICANVALGGAVYYWFGRPGGALERCSVGAGRGCVVRATAHCSEIAQPFTPVACRTKPPAWHTIESADYEQYVANLRAVGCPAKTIRDIILADVESHYAARRRVMASEGTFWLAGNQRRAADRTKKAKLDALRQEQEELVLRLLGIEWIPDDAHASDKLEEQALLRFMFGPMPEESWRRVLQLMERCEALEQEVERHCDRIRLEEDDARIRDIHEQTVRELASSLTPAQLEELTARMAAFELGNHVEFDGVEITPDELRQIALARAAAGGGIFGWRLEATEEKQDEQEEQFRAVVKSILGDSRHADFERAQDRAFRTLFAVSKDNGLSKAAAVKVFEMRKLTVEEVRRVREDASLAEETRARLIEEMQAAVQTAVLDVLGAKAWQSYLDRGGAWLTNLSVL
jgi:hypothetical protein